MTTMIEFVSKAAHQFQLSEFRDHLRLATTDDDPAAQRSLDAAVEAVESWTGRLVRACIVEQSEGYYVPPFRSAYYPVVSGTTTVTRYDSETGVSDDASSFYYVLKSRGGYHLVPVVGSYLDTIKKTLTWRYTAGTTDVPANLKLAVYGVAAHWYENRELVNEARLETVPIAYRSIIEDYRNGEL